MRYRLAVLAVVLLTGTISAPLTAGQARASAPPQQKLPPLSYVCVMAGDEAVLEDKPGKCPNPKCGMDLVPVRLDSKWWCPTHQTVVVRDAPGTCPLDRKDLVQVTLSEFWTCTDKPTDRLLEPGNCAGGQPRKIGYELRAHGDHNPRHDGQFFMAEDQWHHVEGTLPAAGLFRMFFYDNFTKPLAPKEFSGRLARDINGKAESIPLTLSPDGKTLQARLTPASTPAKGQPVTLKAWVKFKKETKENLFDFGFDHLSVEPKAAPAAPAPAPPRTTSNTPAAPAPTPAAAAARPAAPQQPPATPAPAPAPANPEPLILDSPTQIPPALAEALDESKLPTNTPDLLAELTNRAKEVESLVNEGNLSQVWLPATGTKTVALVLDARSTSLPERQRVAVSAAVKRVVTAAWELDAYGDLGNRGKILDAYQRLASAVTDLKAAYGSR